MMIGLPFQQCGFHSLANYNNNNYVTNLVLGLEYKDEYNTIHTYTIVQRHKTMKNKETWMLTIL